ncbi:MAG: hypothetical protein JWN25_3066 [Verrucomicrobiales bacterium]|nr:hypothetical protein [Verrucomicrobiales bacterium]MDB6131692.1 hypothetical protein [Verrucomicrobiales bacterium]
MHLLFHYEFFYPYEQKSGICMNGIDFGMNGFEVENERGSWRGGVRKPGEAADV